MTTTDILKPYNIEELKKRFESMTDEEVYREYALITEKRWRLLDSYRFDIFIDLIGDIDEARDFLGHYIATKFVVDNGYLPESP